MTLEAIIFDVDGTLAETEELHRAAFNQAFVDAGLDWEWTCELYGRLLRIAGGKERLRHFVEETRVIRAAKGDVETLIAALHRRKTRHYLEAVAKGEIAARPGVLALISGARRDGVRLALATTTGPANVKALLQAIIGEEGGDIFEVIAAGDCVSQKKPAPDIYHETLARLDLSPDACLAVEDSANGLESALQAGVVTVIAASVYSRNEIFTGAARVVSSLDELARPASAESAGEAPSPEDMIAAARAIHAEAVAARLATDRERLAHV